MIHDDHHTRTIRRIKVMKLLYYFYPMKKKSSSQRVEHLDNQDCQFLLIVDLGEREIKRERWATRKSTRPIWILFYFFFFDFSFVFIVTTFTFFFLSLTHIHQVWTLFFSVYGWICLFLLCVRIKFIQIENTCHSTSLHTQTHTDFTNIDLGQVKFVERKQ